MEKVLSFSEVQPTAAISLVQKNQYGTENLDKFIEDLITATAEGVKIMEDKRINWREAFGFIGNARDLVENFGLTAEIGKELRDLTPEEFENVVTSASDKVEQAFKETSERARDIAKASIVAAIANVRLTLIIMGEKPDVEITEALLNAA